MSNESSLEAVLVGQPNSGKTLFALNFAGFLGLPVAGLAASGTTGKLSLAAAKRRLVEGTANSTRAPQSFEIRVASGKISKLIQVTDTPGITDVIHEDPDIRRAMSLSLKSLRRARLVLHMIDAASVGALGGRGIATIDRQIAEYAAVQCPYAILANKMDLPLASTGLELISAELSGRRIIPVSALQKRGFREVRAFVWRYV